jgi:hypothetical protein
VKNHKHEPQFMGYDEGDTIYWCAKCGAIKKRWFGRWAIRNHTASWRLPSGAK